MIEKGEQIHRESNIFCDRFDCRAFVRFFFSGKVIHSFEGVKVVCVVNEPE